MPALAIRRDLSAAELRRLGRFEPDRRAAMRLLAIANALEGLSRADAARLAGMERQALRDAVLRYNADGVEGLHDRPKLGRPQRLSEAEQAVLAARVFTEPDPKRDGTSGRPGSFARMGASCSSARPDDLIPVHRSLNLWMGCRRAKWRGGWRTAPCRLLPSVRT